MCVDTAAEQPSKLVVQVLPNRQVQHYAKEKEVRNLRTLSGTYAKDEVPGTARAPSTARFSRIRYCCWWAEPVPGCSDALSTQSPLTERGRHNPERLMKIQSPLPEWRQDRRTDMIDRNWRLKVVPWQHIVASDSATLVTTQQC